MTKVGASKERVNGTFGQFIDKITVNLEIFMRILFSQIALKDIFATFKICDLDMINIHQ